MPGADENGMPSPRLSRERVLQAALELVDEQGHEKLTMRMLAARLDVDPMAAYYYVPNKSALFDGVVEQIWSAVTPEDLDPSGDPSQQLVRAFCMVYQRLIQHPHALPLIATRSAATPQSLVLAERALELLDHAGFSPEDGVTLVNLLAALTIGRALAEAAPAAGGQSMDDVLALAGQFPRLAVAAQADRDPGTAPLERALRGILTAWGFPGENERTPNP